MWTGDGVLGTGFNRPPRGTAGRPDQSPYAQLPYGWKSLDQVRPFVEGAGSATQRIGAMTALLVLAREEIVQRRRTALANRAPIERETQAILRVDFMLEGYRLFERLAPALAAWLRVMDDLAEGAGALDFLLPTLPPVVPDSSDPPPPFTLTPMQLLQLEYGLRLLEPADPARLRRFFEAARGFPVPGLRARVDEAFVALDIVRGPSVDSAGRFALVWDVTMAWFAVRGVRRPAPIVAGGGVGIDALLKPVSLFHDKIVGVLNRVQNASNRPQVLRSFMDQYGMLSQWREYALPR